VVVIIGAGHPKHPQELIVPCDVVITENKISISCDAEDGSKIVYEGKNNNNEHYILTWRDEEGVKGEGTLHRINKESRIMEGYWIEKKNDQKGFWRIFLEK